MASPIGDGTGTRKGARLGCLIAVLSTLVVLACGAVVYVGLAAITHQPHPTTSTRSTP